VSAERSHALGFLLHGTRHRGRCITPNSRTTCRRRFAAIPANLANLFTVTSGNETGGNSSTRS
jgi:hypothetical protein